MKLRAWISAMRLRTLPLSLSCILLGTFLAFSHDMYRHSVVSWAMLTTLFLQILSNLANDYGDGVKGTDNADRIGPERAVQSGEITPRAMRRGMAIFAILAFLSGIRLLYVSFGEPNLMWAIFLGLGIAAIWAAIQYTVGKSAYGYRGFGDVFVFLFFGWTGVMGTYYLHTHEIDPWVLLPASAFGLLSVAVLNLNNMRDRITDQKAGKHTVAVKLGDPGARYYHATLLSMAVLVSVTYTILYPKGWSQHLYLISVLLMVLNIRTVFSIKDPARFDPLLKQMALIALVYAITFGLGQSL